MFLDLTLLAIGFRFAKVFAKKHLPVSLQFFVTVTHQALKNRKILPQVYKIDTEQHMTILLFHPDNRDLRHAR
jgi:hypothetical protein